MNEINIAKSLINKRKEKGITQEELANFIGVTKASVSKWETGHTYPDIVFLPQLAAFFNTSLDDLMAYEPQMTNEDIRKLYKELSIEFSAKPFDEVMERCRGITKKFFSCFPLLAQIGLLFLNYGLTAKEKNTPAIAEAKELFTRVKTLSDDVELKKFALHLEAFCYLSLGNSIDAIDLLEDKNISIGFDKGKEFLAAAYQMKGEIKKAEAVLQSRIYECLMGLFSSIPLYLSVCIDDKKQFEEICNRTKELIRVFRVKTLHPVIIISFYLTAAQGYLKNNNSEKSLEMLEEYTELATGKIYPLKLKGDDFFNSIDGWLKELPFGSGFPPRDEKSIKQSIVNSVIKNPVFSVLKDAPRYKSIAVKLKNISGEDS